MKINPIIPTQINIPITNVKRVKPQALPHFQGTINARSINNNQNYIKEHLQMLFKFASFLKKFKDIKINKIQELHIKNFRILDKNLLSGATFEDRPLEDLKELKRNGIETIIDFREEASNRFRDNCKQNNIKYYNFVLDNVMNFQNKEYFQREENQPIIVKEKFIENLKKFFDTINNQKTYMGCHYGVDRTNLSVVMNYLLNSNSTNAPDIITWPGEKKKTIANKNIKVVKKLLKHLDAKQRKELNIPENYSEELNKRIYILLLKNDLL